MLESLPRLRARCENGKFSALEREVISIIHWSGAFLNSLVMSICDRSWEYAQLILDWHGETALSLTLIKRNFQSEAFYYIGHLCNGTS
jgi:hypothetical protein